MIAGDPRVAYMFPDEFHEGIEKFIKNKLLHRIFDFVSHYVRRLYSDTMITKTLKKNPGRCFFQIITASDIAYVISVIKNGQDMWNQEMTLLARNEDLVEVEPTKKARPLFTHGMGKKRLFGVSLWNKAGLEYYHKAEENWLRLYNSEELFSKLCNEWERWEPKDMGIQKKALKTWWKDEEDIVGTLTHKEQEENEALYYDRGGYTAVPAGVIGVWKYDDDIGLELVPDDDDNVEDHINDKNKGGGVVVDTGKEGGDEGDSSANVTTENRKSGRGGGRKKK